MEKLAVEKSDFSHMEFSQSDAGEYEIPAKKSKRMRDAPIRYRDDEDVIEGRLLAHRGNKNKEKPDERRIKALKENFNMLPKPPTPIDHPVLSASATKYSRSPACSCSSRVGSSIECTTSG